MNFQQRSKYHMVAGEFSISKAFIRERVRYSTWRKRECLGVFDTLSEAMAKAEEEVEK